MSLNLEQANAGSFCLSKVALAIGSTNTQLSTGAAANYTIDGTWQTQKGATATFALAAPAGFAFSTIPIGGKASFGVWLDSAGTFTVTQGSTSNVASNADKAAPPPNPGGRTMVGVFTAYAATAAYVPGTTALTGAGVTVVYFDMFSLPASGF